MKVLMISTDTGAFNDSSAVRARLRKLALACEELRVIVLTARGFSVVSDGKLTLYPTNSLLKIFRISGAQSLGVRLCLENDFDLITVQDPFATGLVGASLAHKFLIPLQIQVHTDVFSPNFINLNIINRTRVVLARRLLAKATRLRVVSARVRDNIMAELGKNLPPIDILPVFVDAERVRAAERKNLHADFSDFSKIVLVVARLVPEKNVAMAVEAVTLARTTNKDIGLVIIGDGPEQKEFSHLPFVRCLGKVENVAGYFKGADAVLATSWYEGYGMVLVEAALAGVPVVTTDVGVAPEIIFSPKPGVPGNGEVVKTFKSRDLAAALIRVLNNPGDYGVRPPQLISADDYFSAYISLWQKTVEKV